MSAGPVQGRGCGGSEAVPVTIRGVRYDSIGAAAAALGVPQTAIASAKRRGNGALDRVGLRGRRNRGLMPVVVRGQWFDCVADCATHFGLRQMTVYTAVAEGRADWLGLGRGANFRAQAAARLVAAE